MSITCAPLHHNADLLHRHDGFVDRLVHAASALGRSQRFFQDDPPVFRVGATPYAWFDAVTAFPMLARGYHQVYRDPAHVTDTARAAALRDLDIRDLQNRVRQGHLDIPAPRTIQIPKPTFPSGLSIQALDDQFVAQPTYLNGTKRPIRILDADARAVAGAAATVFGAFYSHRMPSCVVGSRAGLGGVQVWSMLAQSIRTEHRHVLVLLDLKDFFGSIPVHRCLDLLHRDTGYRRDPVLGRLIHRLLTAGTPPGTTAMLPQGNPLSPLLANIFGLHVLDNVGRHCGPYLRYVDDLAVAVADVPAALEASSRIRAAANDAGLTLSGSKSAIIDLNTRRQYDLAGQEQPYAPTFLGWGIGFDGGGVTPQVTDTSIWKLQNALRTAAFHPSHMAYDGRQSPLDRLGIRTERSMDILAGWLLWHGHASMTQQHHEAVQHLIRKTVGTADDWEARVTSLARDGFAGGDDRAVVQALAGPLGIPRAAHAHLATGRDLANWMTDRLHRSIDTSRGARSYADEHPQALQYFDGVDGRTPRSTVLPTVTA